MTETEKSEIEGITEATRKELEEIEIKTKIKKKSQKEQQEKIKFYSNIYSV